MCRDLSLIVMRPKNGDRPRIIRGIDTNHHHEMIELHNLREGVGAVVNEPAFARCEYFPVDQDWGKCQFKIDEERRPKWFNSDIEEFVRRDCEAWAKSITIDSNRGAVCGGTWIIKGEVTIQCANRCRFLVGKTAELAITRAIQGDVVFGVVSGTVTTGVVFGTVTTGDVLGTVTTGDVSGTVTTGDVFGTGSVKTGDVCGTGSVKTGDVCGTGSVIRGSKVETAPTTKKPSNSKATTKKKK